MPPSPELTFWEHVGSLRAHLLAAAAAVTATTTFCLAFAADHLIALLLVPLDGRELVFLTVFGPLLFKLHVSLFAGIAAAAPLWAAIVLHFAAPALSGRWWFLATAVAAAVAATGMLAVLAAYLLLIPASLHVLLGIAIDGTSVIISADSYFDFVLMQIVVAFVVVELPVVIVGATATGLLDPRIISGRRAYLHVGLLIGLAMLTPTTDLVSLFVASVPAALLAEAGLAVAGLIHSRRSGPPSPDDTIPG